MAKYDIESFMADVEAFLKANLNTKITAINSEKNDTITLPSIPDEGYFLQTLNDTVTNYNPFIFFGVDSVETEGTGPANKDAYSVDVILCFADQGADAPGAVAKKLYRFSRVLGDLFKENYDRIGRAGKIKVKSLSPVSFKFLNSSDDYRAVGVTLDFTLA